MSASLTVTPFVLLLLAGVPPSATHPAKVDLIRSIYFTNLEAFDPDLYRIRVGRGQVGLVKGPAFRPVYPQRDPGGVR